MTRNPVLLVHGFFLNSQVFVQLAGHLQARGWSVYAFDLQQDYRNLGLPDLAAQVADYIQKTFDRSQRIDLVGFSMGGVICRYYLQRLGGCDRVRHFVNISAPNYGTWMAYLLPHLVCVQMRPHSSFLQDLNRDIDKLNLLNVTCLWTDWDFIIVPASSSQIPGSKNIKLPVFLHPLMVYHPICLEAIAEALL